jgi:hypothetical protein
MFLIDQESRDKSAIKSPTFVSSVNKLLSSFEYGNDGLIGCYNVAFDGLSVCLCLYAVDLCLCSVFLCSHVCLSVYLYPPPSCLVVLKRADIWCLYFCVCVSVFVSILLLFVVIQCTGIQFVATDGVTQSSPLHCMIACRAFRLTAIYNQSCFCSNELPEGSQLDSSLCRNSSQQQSRSSSVVAPVYLFVFW